MYYINDLSPGDCFMVREKRGIWMRTKKVFNWILNEDGIQNYRRSSELDQYRDHGFLCVDVDTGDLFVFTEGNGEKNKLDICLV